MCQDIFEEFIKYSVSLIINWELMSDLVLGMIY